MLPTLAEVLGARMLKHYAKLNDFLLEHAPSGPFLFDEFGWAEAVFTPFFVRFWFLKYAGSCLAVEVPVAPGHCRLDGLAGHPAPVHLRRENPSCLRGPAARGHDVPLPVGEPASSFRWMAARMNQQARTSFRHARRVRDTLSGGGARRPVVGARVFPGRGIS